MPGKVIQKAFLFLSSEKYNIQGAHWCDFSHMGEDGDRLDSTFSLISKLAL